MKAHITRWMALPAVAFVMMGNISRAQHEPPIADGFYQVVESGTGIEVGRTTGGAVRLVEHRSSAFGDVSMWSVANDNSRWRVQFEHVPAFDCTGTLGLYCDGVCERVSSYSSPGESGSMELLVDIQGQENAERLAAKLGCQPQPRHHPGHKMLVHWKPLQQSYQPGEPLLLELAIENVGEESLRFIEGGQQRGPRDNQFRFIAQGLSGYGKAIPDVGDPTNFGGLGGFRELKPGEVFRKEVELTKWFQFAEPDTYRITGLYELDLQDEGYHRVVWHDFAVGECVVRIEAVAKGKTE